MENKLTSIEWLEKELIKQGFLYDLDIEVAKDLHRKEISRAYQEGLIDGMNHSPKDYCKETFLNGH